MHQPNLFPRLTTLAKLFAADCWIVLDDVQFTRRDYQHRTRLAAPKDPDRTQWLSILTHLPQGRQTAIRDTLIAVPAAARRRTEAMIRQEYRTSPPGPPSRLLWSRSGPPSTPAGPPQSPRPPPASCWTSSAGRAAS